MRHDKYIKLFLTYLTSSSGSGSESSSSSRFLFTPCSSGVTPVLPGVEASSVEVDAPLDGV